MTRKEIIDAYHDRLRAIRSVQFWEFRKQDKAMRKAFESVEQFIRGVANDDHKKHDLSERTGT